MLLRVELAGHVGYWRFPGTATFHDWLAACPWLHEGGACVLRLPALSNGSTFAEAVAQSLYGLDRGFTQLRVEMLDGAEMANGVREGLAQHFGIDASARSWQVTDALSQLFMKRPTVLVVTPPGVVRDRDIWQEAVALRDEMAKTGFGPTLTCVLMDCGAHRLDARLAFDFSHGAPVFGVFDTVSQDLNQLWNVYVHCRLAWECAGDPSLAEKMLEDVDVRLRSGHDEHLEQVLNLWAGRALSQVSEEDRLALDACLGADRDAATGRLIERGLLWRQSGLRSPVPTPWVARGLLLTNTLHPRRWLLRGALVCVPLANELLARCQEWEQHIKGQCCGVAKAAPGSCPEEVYKLWDRCRRMQDETTVYPLGHPAPPIDITDAWVFASLGQLLNDTLSPLGRPAGQSELSLTRLRNTLAHGHYVCWHHVRTLWRITDALGKR